MEGMFLQFVPVLGSLVAGVLLLGMVVAATVYCRSHRMVSRLADGQGELRKAA